MTFIASGVIHGRPGAMMSRLAHSHGTGLILVSTVFLLGDSLSADWTLLITWPLTYIAMAVILVTTGAGRRWYYPAAAVAALTFPLGILGLISGVEELLAPGSEVLIFYLLASLVVILRDVLRRQIVTLDAVFGAFTAYLLIGIAFALIYSVTANIESGAFNPPQHPGEDAELFYFSFVTLTTVGFGDITPANDWVRSIAVLEGLVGQMFLVVLVARLVGMEVAQRKD